MGKDNLFHKNREGRRKRLENIQKDRQTQWLILCEGGKTEPYYFDALVKYLNIGSHKSIDIRTCGEGTSTTNLVNRAKDYFTYFDNLYGSMYIPYEKIIFVFDRDSFGAGEFNKAISMAHRVYPDSIIAWSNESFELWLCLHFEYITSALPRQQYNDKLTALFRRHGIYSIKQNYDENGKNDPGLFKKIINCGGTLEQAIRNAERLTSNKTLYNPAKANPATMVFEAVKVLVNESTRS